jgi:hypothetical protein
LNFFLTKKDEIKENSQAGKLGGSIAASGDDPSKMSFSNADGQSETGSRAGTNESLASESGIKLTSKIPHHNSDYTLYCFENAKHKCENFIKLIEKMRDMENQRKMVADRMKMSFFKRILEDPFDRQKNMQCNSDDPDKVYDINSKVDDIYRHHYPAEVYGNMPVYTKLFTGLHLHPCMILNI